MDDTTKTLARPTSPLYIQTEIETALSALDQDKPRIAKAVLKGLLATLRPDIAAANAEIEASIGE